MAKVVAISDTHGNLPQDLPSGDILCIAGDICPATDHSYTFQKRWIEETWIPWCHGLIKLDKFKHVVFIAGNHDFYMENLYEEKREHQLRNMLPEGVHYLRDSVVVLDGLWIYGTPWVNKFYDWAFMCEEPVLEKHFEKIPKMVDILISHGPPSGLCDKVVGRSDPLGSVALKSAIDRVSPVWCFCGHIHTGSHIPVYSSHAVDATRVVNVSILDERYEPGSFDIFSTEVTR